MIPYDIDWGSLGSLMDGAFGLASLWLAVQVRSVLKNHEGRIEVLEDTVLPRRKPARKRLRGKRA